MKPSERIIQMKEKMISDYQTADASGKFLLAPNGISEERVAIASICAYLDEEWERRNAACSQ